MKNTCKNYTSVKIIRYSYQLFYFLLIYINFYISWYHFNNFLERHLTLSEIFFSFLMDSPKPPPLLTTKICWAWQKLFVDVLLHYSFVETSTPYEKSSKISVTMLLHHHIFWLISSNIKFYCTKVSGLWVRWTSKVLFHMVKT